MLLLFLIEVTVSSQAESYLKDEETAKHEQGQGVVVNPAFHHRLLVRLIPAC